MCIPYLVYLIYHSHGARYFTHKFTLPEIIFPKTPFCTCYGHYEFSIMPFELTNAPITFQDELNGFVVVFLGKISISTCSLQDHVQHVRFVLHKLHNNLFQAKDSKCDFYVPRSFDYKK